MIKYSMLVALVKFPLSSVSREVAFGAEDTGFDSSSKLILPGQRSIVFLL
jgi:hypothetical protein